MGRWILVLLVGLTLNLIVQTQQDGVGAEAGSGDDGDDASGDEGRDTEGSAEEGLTKCQRLAARANKVPTFLPPQCAEDGEFKPMQCYAVFGQCWCVDKNGKEKPGTRQSLPNKPTCTGRSEFVAPSRKPPGALPGDHQETRSPVLSYSPSDGDDIVLEDASTPKPFSSRKITQRRFSEIQTSTSAFQEIGHSDENVNVHKPPSMFSFIFRDPLILAGIIGGAVLALLCIVLLIMFTIYRMRKKDEGSYALDEPKKSYGFAYTRARDQEFFA